MALSPKIATPRPGFGGWLFALSSACVTIGASAWLLLAAREMRASMAFEGLALSIDRLDFGAARRFVTTLTEPEPIESLVSLVRPTEANDASRKEAVGTLVDVVILVTTGKNDEAFRLFDTSVFPWLSTHLTEDGTGPALARSLQATLVSLVERSRAIGANKILLAKSAQARAQLESRYSLVASDLGELLSLRPEEIGPGDEPLRFYTQGIMEGLPRMHRLRDGIPDLSALGRELGLAGGRVTVEGPTAHEDFMERISAMRESSLRLRTEKEQVDSQTAVASSEIERLRRENSTGRKALVEALEKAVAAMARG